MVLAVLLAIFVGQDIIGIVKDTNGGTVPNAVVVLRSPVGQQQTVTGSDGIFSFSDVPDGSTVVVRAPGFSVTEQQVPATGMVEVIVSPAPLLETLTVTATRTEERLGALPASVHVLSTQEIRQSAAVTADEILRRIPTFSLFRRTSSLSSHPTAQGVSLRGIGPSGVSRTLVLLDGVPFNDPFGGWVYWTRVPMGSIERIEVVDGASSSLYGNYAMGGVINMVTRRASARTFEMKAQYGNLGTAYSDVFAADTRGRFSFLGHGSAFSTDGHPVVVEAERGPVDTKATLTFGNLGVKADYRSDTGRAAYIRTDYFREKRLNGKVSTVDGQPEANDTRSLALSGGLRMLLRDRSDLQARIFTDWNAFNSNFLAVPDLQTRALGRMSLDQRVSAVNVGATAQWTKSFGAVHRLTVGSDWRLVDGASKEQVLDFVRGQAPVTNRESGGTQQSAGAFAQHIFTPVAKASVTFGARLDQWRNYEGRNLETSVATGLPTASHVAALPSRGNTVVSPRVAAVFRFTDRITGWTDLSAGFRAPTLNELYRQFRVGAITTRANHQLGPERLKAAQIGLNVLLANGLTVRASGFDNRLESAVSNVSRSDLVNTQQRQNLGRTRIRGLQTDLDYVRERFRFSAAYMHNRAMVTEYTAAPDLIGKFLPQVPRHRGSLQAAFSPRPAIDFAAAVQLVGAQFDDDLNVRTIPGRSGPGLPAFASLDLTGSWRVHRKLQLFAGVQNVLGQEYFTGMLPTTMGSPRMAHLGVRVRLGS